MTSDLTTKAAEIRAGLVDRLHALASPERVKHGVPQDVAMTEAAALIAQQAASIEAVSSDETFAADSVIDNTAAEIAGLVGPNDEAQAVEAAVKRALIFMRSLANLRLQRAEARATAAEAERDRLLDPVAIHANMLRGTIAKPSLNNIAHLYPEVQQMRQALIATLKHFRHPTSAEHETRDKVEAALSHFDAPPLTPYFAALSTAKERGE